MTPPRPRARVAFDRICADVLQRQSAILLIFGASYHSRITYLLLTVDSLLRSRTFQKFGKLLLHLHHIGYTIVEMGSPD